MGDFTELLRQIRTERPAALDPRNTMRRKAITPLPPSMRGLPGYAASNVSRMAEEDIGRGRALGMEPGRGNQVREAAGMLAETTGLPGALRANQAFSEGDTARGLGEAGMGLLNLAGTASMFAPMRNVPRAPAAVPRPTRIYRGLNEPYNEDRAALLGNRWWHTNPQVASTYAPGTEGAHVIPGQIDESALRMAHLRLTPGTMWRSIPVRELPADIRRQFPRATTHVRSEEVASAAQSAGYDGVTFEGMRDSGFANAMQGDYPGFQTGDDGRVVAIFRDDAVQSPFPRSQSQAPTPPPTLSPTWERAGDGSVLPVRPQSDRLFSRTAPTSADLRGAAATPPAINAPRAQPSLADLGRPGNRPDPGGVFVNASGRPIRAYHGSPHDFDRFDASRIGTGQGAQTYGYGHYLAENEAVAKSYRDDLSGVPDITALRIGDLHLTPRNNFNYSPRSSSAYDNILGSLAEEALVQQSDLIANPANAQRLVLGMLDDRIARLPNEWPEGLADAQRLRADLSRPGAVSLKLGPQPGRMYEVNIHADPQEFLDWDAPLGSRSERINNFVGHMGVRTDPQMSGAEAYRAVTRQNPLQGSEHLRQLDIPGIRYLDQGSRGVPPNQWRVSEPNSDTIAALFDNEAAARAFAAENGGTIRHITNPLSSNYVIFPGMEDIIEILRKYGIGGLGVGAAAGAGAGAQQNAPGS